MIGTATGWYVYGVAEQQDGLEAIAQVVGRIRDIPLLERMTARAYDDVIASGRYSYAAFVHTFDDLVDRRRKAEHRTTDATPSLTRARWNIRQSVRTLQHRAASALETGQPIRFGLRLGKWRFVFGLPFLRLQQAALWVLKKTWLLCKTACGRAFRPGEPLTRKRREHAGV